MSPALPAAPGSPLTPTGAVTAVVDPDRATARQWALEELTRSEYAAAQPNLLQQALGWLFERIDELLDQAGGAGSAFGLLLGLAVLAAVVALALVLAGPLRRRGARRRPEPGGVFGSTVRTAEQHRAAAEQAATEQQWGTATQERFRAAARTLEERVVLDARPGRTADEVATEGGVALPDAAAALGRAARVFDDVTYGERPGDETGYVACVEADEAVRRGRPAGLLAAVGRAPR